MSTKKVDVQCEWKCELEAVKDRHVLGNGNDRAGTAVASDTRRLQFDSSHRF